VNELGYIYIEKQKNKKKIKKQKKPKKKILFFSRITVEFVAPQQIADNMVPIGLYYLY
jgi:hypothetical protein